MCLEARRARIDQMRVLQANGSKREPKYNAAVVVYANARHTPFFNILPDCTPQHTEAPPDIEAKRFISCFISILYNCLNILLLKDIKTIIILPQLLADYLLLPRYDPSNDTNIRM